MSLNTILATAPLATTGFHLKATGTTIGNSLIWDNGTNVGIGNTNTSYTLDVSGTGRFSSNVNIDGEYLTIGGATNNAVINNIASFRFNLDCDNTGTGESFTVGHNQTIINDSNVLFRIQDNGNVGIGTSSPNGPLDVVGPLYGGLYTLSLIDSAAVAADIGGGIYFGGNYTGTTKTGWAGILGRKDNATDGQYGGYMAFLTRTNGSAPAERMRITSGGFVKMSNSGTYGTTNNVYEIRSSTNNDYTLLMANTAASPYGMNINYPNASPNSGSTNEFIICGDSTNTKFIVYSNGTVLNRTGTYGTISSDIRLKENIVEANSKLNDLLKLRVVNFNLIDDDDKKKQIGFIAQEFKEVFPSLVYEKDTREYDKDGNVTKGLEDSLGLNVGMEFAILVKAIQEMNTKLDEQNQTIQNLQEQINILAK